MNLSIPAQYVPVTLSLNFQPVLLPPSRCVCTCRHTALLFTCCILVNLESSLVPGGEGGETTAMIVTGLVLCSEP